MAAQAGEAVVNSEVDVDYAGKDAADARKKAMANGESDALRILLERFTSSQQAKAIMDTLSEQQISDMTRGVEVVNEKISEKRYRARLLVSFDGEAISELVSKAVSGSEALAARTSSAFVIIPVYDEAGRTMLWEESNPWRATWKTVGLEANLNGIVVPYGDSADSAVIDVKNMQTATFASLSKLISRYGASDIVILQAKFVATPEMVLTVIRKRLNHAVSEVNLLTYQADPQETKDMLLVRAANDIIATLQQKKNEDFKNSAAGRGERNSIMILASITTMASWTQLKAKLTALPMVDKVDVLAISPQQVDMNVRYRGTPESLESAIQAQNLRLLKHANYWVISRD
jgi:hypothetical protein